jgi:hypothetical protein
MNASVALKHNLCGKCRGGGCVLVVCSSVDGGRLAMACEVLII